MRASDTATLVMEDCRIPAENLIGAQGEGFVQAMKVLDGGRISIAALALGIAEGAFDGARAYAKQRKQFGKAICEFQTIQYYLADMATEIDAARLLIYRAGWMKDAGKMTTKESAMAKLYASEVAVASRTSRSRSTAGTASRRTSARRSSSATRSSARSARARPRSSAS